MSRRIVVMPQNNGKRDNRPRVRQAGQPQTTSQQSNEISNVTVTTYPSVERSESTSSNGSSEADSRNGSLHVEVRHGDTSRPIEDASVKLSYPGSDGGLISSKKTDKNGSVMIENLKPNAMMEPANLNYSIQVEKPGFNRELVENIQIVPEETTERRVELKPTVNENSMTNNASNQEPAAKNIYGNSELDNNSTLHSMETPPPSDQIDTDIESDTNAGNPDDVVVNTDESEPLPNPDLAQGIGSFRADVISILQSRPITSATVRIYFSGDRENPIEELTTDSIGRTPVIDLPAPNIQYSLEPSVEQPYANYDVLVEVPGFESLEVNNVEVLPDTVSILSASLMPLENAQGESAELFVIPPHTLYGDYPPKIAEAEIKPIGQSGEIVLTKVVIPEYIVVHDGPPSDRSAANYYVKYKDYIKNVASSEIYATWPEATIIANVLCIQSFVLNRVYTEWYRNRGYQFTITNSTAYDQKFIAERNIFDSISEVVDQVFANYITRPNIEQPLFTQFCDGQRVSCPNWLSQWGSKYLGEQGYSAIDILRNYYGNDIYIATAEEVSGVPASWPGVELEIGSRGDSVRQIQKLLNGVSKGYPLIPKVAQDGVYGQKTADAVKTFQRIFDLPQTGVVDFPTWYKISEIYVGVTRIAELN